MTQAHAADSLYVHCNELVTLADGAPEALRRGEAMQALGVIRDGAIAVRDGLVAAVGTTDELGPRFPDLEAVDLSGFTVIPGFVDCHTHPVFAATREEEFHQRCAGADYMAIAAAGGGILSSVRSVREAGLDELTQITRAHLQDFLAHGTTTVEAKSGYGLSTESELKSLVALRDAMAQVPLDVYRTFLGAHEFPSEYREDRDTYVKLVVEEMLPAVVEAGLADACDVFAEPGVFDREQSRRVLQAALDLGLQVRMHADELQPMGGSGVGIDLGALSVDHLGRISDEDIAALAASDTVGVMLPGTLAFLAKDNWPPARRMIDAGCAVALASDFNPGSSHTQSMTLIATLACNRLKMTPEECLTAMTINPAVSLGMADRVGSLHVGKQADFCALDLPGYRSLGYAFGGNPVALTVKRGRPVVANVREWDPVLAGEGQRGS